MVSLQSAPNEAAMEKMHKVKKVDKVDDLMEKVNNLVLRWKRDKVECGKGVEFFC